MSGLLTKDPGPQITCIQPRGNSPRHNPTIQVSITRHRSPHATTQPNNDLSKPGETSQRHDPIPSTNLPSTSITKITHFLTSSNSPSPSVIPSSRAHGQPRKPAECPGGKRTTRRDTRPPRPSNPMEPQPPAPQHHETDTPPANVPDPPSSSEADESMETQLPTTASVQLKEFQAHWATTFGTDLTWEDFSEQCSLFADATRVLANNLRPPRNQTNPAFHNQNTTTTHQPRGNRPTRCFNPTEAQRIQGMYRHSKKRAARKILTNNTAAHD